MAKKWIKNSLKILLVLVLVAWLVLALIPAKANFAGENPLRIEEGARPMLIAHGGGNREFPDNTLEAFYHAYSIDPDCMMETDVSITQDGIIILSHDTTLDRKTNTTGAIEDHTYQSLLDLEIDFGYENTEGELVPYTNYLGENVTPQDVTYPVGISPRHASKFLVTTLEELIKAFPTNYINVEIKQSGETGHEALATVLTLLETLDDEYHTFSRIVLASFHDEIYEELVSYQKNTNPTLMYSPAIKRVATFYVLQLFRIDSIFTDGIAVFQLPVRQYNINLASKSIIKIAHRHNIAVHYWTIDDEVTMKYLIQNGADGIMTNIPSLLKQVYDEVFPS
ncbi:MAG: glycerophosphodiester phosphodiesterase family protein [Bacilli bacterium]|nr:glycerophosphodiester phosphodiesterase family protein [Bacilli bacterium]